MNLTGKSILVLGLGESGLAMAQWAARCGARVRVADSRNEPPYAEVLRTTAPSAELITGVFAPELLDGMELLGLSPGLSLTEPLVMEAIKRGVRVVGEIEMFVWALESLHWRSECKIVAITGTNGKTTVTSLTGAMCRAAGIQTEVAGNIGPAALAALMTCVERQTPPQIWVLELSSFQLETTHSLLADAAVVLNVTDDHMDRYDGLDDYAAAKARIFLGQGVQVLNRRDECVMAMAQPGRHIVTFGLDEPGDRNAWGVRVDERGDAWLSRGEECVWREQDMHLAGRHNVANALAALALCSAVDVPVDKAASALADFKGLPHRVEHVMSLEGVDYYDDSKGTNVGATVAALEGLARKVVLIAGGDGKEQDFSPLRPALKEHGRALVLIGRDAMRIEAAVEGCDIPIHHAQDMVQAVRKAALAARSGDAVLLSPACASFDMYRNYVHRAEVFVETVRQHATLREERSV